VKAVTGAADQDLHDWQWQYPIASGSPETSKRTAAQKHSPLCVGAIVASSLRHSPAGNVSRSAGMQSDRCAFGVVGDSGTNPD
jgi:hypothetical protein